VNKGSATWLSHPLGYEVCKLVCRASASSAHSCTLVRTGGQAAGYAAADSVQALPLVSTFWGIVLFGEYRRCSKRTFFLLIAMLCAFAAAVGLLMGSSGTRKN